MSILKKISRTTLIVIISIVVLLVALRLALPSIIKHAVNKKLNELPDYTGHIDDVDLHIYRGAYAINGVEILKRNGKVPVPFFSAGTMEFSVEWRQLFRGHLVATIRIFHPMVNFVQGPTKEQSQTTADKRWQDKVKDLFPLKINSFKIVDGEIHFRNPYSDPKVDVFVRDLQVTATNLTNSLKVAKTLASNLNATGTIMGSGRFKVDVDLDPFREQPTFNLDMQLTNVSLVKLNDFLRAYAKFDVHKGTFNMYSEVAARDGRYEGYLKPLLKDVEVVKWKEDIKKPVFELLWKVVVGAVKDIFTNPPKEQVATKVPFSGSFGNTSVGVWPSIWELIKNAFIQALMPGLDKTISMKDVSKKD
ncbi:MAG: DUF748 domain-containing protein [Ignavibacteria bacterium]|jgi:uncharacterized protein YhdP|nr:DUF748 domain-containing protein [Ignavibacteria bacterium]MCU7503291.1 DUF748 domain-containing protein [Ignavibacteria bacterium]MCU7515763.1 DUF748 domain-containing protein [Ignavibacteria bacterium]